MILSPNQKEAYSSVMDWHKNGGKFFSIAGYAGTGKTTLARYIAQEIDRDRTIFCAYTGKAANVLKEKGCPNAGTIHSYLYKWIETKDEKPVFGLNHESCFLDAPLVIVDEYSMIPDDIIDDIHKMAKKILYLGDPFQLPPVRKTNTIIEPDIFLTEVHRQALESPILRAATNVREGHKLKHGDYGDFRYARHEDCADDALQEADQVIVGRNATRREINSYFIRLLNFSEIPQGNGEKLICLRNKKEKGLFNGMIGSCDSAYDHEKDYFRMDFNCDGDPYPDLKVRTGPFKGEDQQNFMGDFKSELFDYAYAITCHKSQGSEFKNVLIFNEPIGKTHEERQRWLYTALTRAQNRATLVDL